MCTVTTTTITTTAAAAAVFNPERWYCILVVKTPTQPVGRKRPRDDDDGVVIANAAAAADDAATAEKSCSVSLQQQHGERRTHVQITQDPIEMVEQLNKNNSHSKTYRYEIATLLGPFQTETEASIIRTLWNFKSRSVIPRAIWAEVLANKFRLPLCHQPEVLLGLSEHFSIVSKHDGTVYLYPRNKK
jgi:hypothetical protein